MPIKTTVSGLIILKNGKPSCECCLCIINWGPPYPPYSNGMVTAVDPWSFTPDGTVIRFDFEDSAGVEDPNNPGTMIGACGDAINPNTQTGGAVGMFESPFDTIMTVTVVGQGETVSSAFDLLEVRIDSTLVINANAPGGGSDSCVMGASVISPVPLPPGDPLTTGGVSHPDYFLAGGVPHTIALHVNSRDAQWHQDAFYEITFTCRAPATPPDPPPP